MTLTITSTGHGHMSYADLTLCPSCSFASAPVSTIDFTLTAGQAGAAGPAIGTVTASSDPRVAAVGAPVTATLEAGSPGVILDLRIGSQAGGRFCNSTSVGQCGA